MDRKDRKDSKAFTDKFDAAYSNYAGLYDWAVKHLPVWKDWIQQALPHIRGPRVLEVSFGTGYLLGRFAGRFESFGVDYNFRMTQVAGKNLRITGLPDRLAQGDVAALPFPKASFDTLVNTMAFSGYPDPDAALKEIRRVLNPDGRLVMVDVTDPKSKHAASRLMARLWLAAGDILYEMPALFEQHGFNYTKEVVGGFGSVVLYVAQKRS